MMNNQQAYQILDLHEGATKEDIELRFHDLMSRYNPENANLALRSEYQTKQQEFEAAYKILTGTSQSPSSPESNSSLSLKDIPKISPKAQLGKIIDVVPEATREEIIQNAKGILEWERKRSTAQQDRIFQEINNLMPQPAGMRAITPSALRMKFIDEVGRHVGEALNPRDRLLLFIALTVPILPLCGAVISTIPKLSAMATLFYIASVVTFVLSIITNVKISAKINSLRGTFLSMIQPFVYGNLNAAKSSEDLSRIQELISYSLLFIDDFDLNREIVQQSTNRSITQSTSISHKNSYVSSSSSVSYSNEIGTLNPRFINRLKRMVKYAQDAWANPSLTDYEREKVLDEVHSSLDQSTKVDPSEWTCDILTGRVLEYAYQQYSATKVTGLLIGGGGIITTIIGIIIVSKMGFTAPLFIGFGVIAYLKRDTLAAKMRPFIEEKAAQMKQEMEKRAAKIKQEMEKQASQLKNPKE
jgi:hypothetical protein